MLTPLKLTKRQTVQIIEQLHHKKNYYLLCSFYPHCDKVEHVKNRQRRQQLKIITLLYQGLNNLMGRQTFVLFVYFVSILTCVVSFVCYTFQQHSYERNHIYPFNFFLQSKNELRPRAHFSAHLDKSPPTSTIGCYRPCKILNLATVILSL